MQDSPLYCVHKVRLRRAIPPAAELYQERQPLSAWSACSARPLTGNGNLVLSFRAMAILTSFSDAVDATNSIRRRLRGGRPLSDLGVVAPGVLVPTYRKALIVTDCGCSLAHHGLCQVDKHSAFGVNSPRMLRRDVRMLLTSEHDRKRHSPVSIRS